MVQNKNETEPVKNLNKSGRKEGGGSRGSVVNEEHTTEKTLSQDGYISLTKVLPAPHPLPKGSIKQEVTKSQD